ncbi:MAG: hypothetical protein CSA95_06890 [Bacteroidetes bacterium]|nr:MAG: hypothetical protein CSA95_06890 [Bacteroidota bacterium]PIE88517.1 MAG: hypothetical protein CSA04_01615 [Bacteroidota bacterium]
MKSLPRYIVGVLSLLLLVFFVWRFDNIVWYIIIGLVLSFIGSPIASQFDRIHVRRWHFPRWLSSLLSVIILLLGVYGFFRLIIPLVADQAEVVAQIDVEEVGAMIEEPVENLTVVLYKYGIVAEGESIISTLEQQLSSLLNLATFSDLLSNIVSVAGSLFIGLFAVLFIAFFFIKDENLFQSGIMLFVPERHTQKVSNVLRNSKRLLSRYFLGLLGEMLTMMTLESIGLTVFGIRGAFLIAFLGGMLNVIPYLGPILGAGVGTTIGVATVLSMGLYDQVWITAIIILSIFIVCNLIDNIILQPFIYSNSVDAHPLEIFLVIFIFGDLGGVLGMILAIPGYTVIRIIAREFLGAFRVVRSITGRMQVDEGKKEP